MSYGSSWTYIGEGYGKLERVENYVGEACGGYDQHRTLYCSGCSGYRIKKCAVGLLIGLCVLVLAGGTWGGLLLFHDGRRLPTQAFGHAVAASPRSSALQSTHIG